ncbi:MAG: ferrous iron transport protein A [Lachnospiraceae bacterium]|jgi:ferrous iron transport protein A|nr:ferrous iron transport protein A [Lachnospiraceae bacterium]MBR2654043.1 ferrous iron transport protein A [Lachnospiraceae bacterium]MBR3170111.1 ferrous iron transport protein A [Lachnospiraceae bacterium]
MPLRLADLEKEYEIIRLGGSPDVKQHLADMGFHVGAKVTVVSRAGESVIVNIKGVRVAIGKELAGKIFV